MLYELYALDVEVLSIIMVLVESIIIELESSIIIELELSSIIIELDMSSIIMLLVDSDMSAIAVDVEYEPPYAFALTNRRKKTEQLKIEHNTNRREIYSRRRRPTSVPILRGRVNETCCESSGTNERGLEVNHLEVSEKRSKEMSVV